MREWFVGTRWLRVATEERCGAPPSSSGDTWDQETMKRICVFAGSSPGSRKAYLAAAQELGRALVRRQIGLVYGGARVGLMGALADAVLAAHGHVTGVIPERLAVKEVADVVSRGSRISGSSRPCTSGRRSWPTCPTASLLQCDPRRVGHAGGVLRSPDVGATGPASEAVRPAERRRLLRWPTVVPRSCDRRAFRQTGESIDGHRGDFFRRAS